MKPGKHSQTKIGDFVIGSHVNDLDEFDFYNQFLGGSLFREQTAKALKHAALLVKKSTLDALRSSFASAFKGGGYHYVGGGEGHKRRDGSTKRFYKDSLSEGVLVGKLKGGWNHQEIKVHIMGSRAKDSGTYRLRFYEAGGPRKLRGSIPGHGFFKAGRHQVNIWEQIKKNIDEYLKDHGWK